jgi:hypothetical protein
MPFTLPGYLLSRDASSFSPRATVITSAPSETNSLTIASPIPFVPPVTSAFFPLRFHGEARVLMRLVWMNEVRYFLMTNA